MLLMPTLCLPGQIPDKPRPLDSQKGGASTLTQLFVFLHFPLLKQHISFSLGSFLKVFFLAGLTRLRCPCTRQFS